MKRRRLRWRWRAWRRWFRLFPEPDTETLHIEVRVSKALLRQGDHSALNAIVNVVADAARDKTRERLGIDIV